MLVKITSRGPLVRDTVFPGERRADGAVPSHPTAVRLSQRVWMLLFGTRKFTGIDDDNSIFYQLRRDQPDGPLIKEAPLIRARDGWDPLRCGDNLWKAHGSPTAFGVPKGAMIDGMPMPHANIFVAKWYTYPKLVRDGKHVNVIPDYIKMEASAASTKSHRQHLIHLEWVQFRLNDREDNIELLHDVQPLCQLGFEDAPRPCDVAHDGMNHSMMPPKPLSEHCDTWLEVDHFGSNFHDARLAAVCYRFDPASGLYQWVRTGPLSPQIGEPLIEATLNRVGGVWIVCARSHRNKGQTVWFRVEDPLSCWSEPVFHDVPQSWCPRVAEVGPDGVLRIFCNDTASSPYGDVRNPLSCWEVNINNFTTSSRRIIFDCRKAGYRLRFPFIDCPKPMPASNGRQLLGFRVLTPYKWHATKEHPALTQEEFDCCGMHYAELHYDQPVVDPWTFVNQPQDSGV